MKTALKNNFEKTLLVLLPIVMCMYARQTLCANGEYDTL